ncbi:hypothetical protein SpCBS45565_g01195 [Spizellomyces sp. 'palustris']|nr:hypothetical protein SpCBS45565_g01195 [Spizellomyces sp. 'palustris']
MGPAGESLLTVLVLDYAIQLVFYLISAPLKTEKLYDASGALTFFACTLTALLWRRDGQSLDDLSARQILVAVLVIVWCLRLGTFLAIRVSKTEDKRFEKFKHNPIKFSVVWVMQAFWVFMTAFPVYIVLGNPSKSQRSFGASDIIGLIIWVYGFIVEVVADSQKFRFKNRHPRDFVSTGIWRYSRYANYNGEIFLWIGMFILCARGFEEGWQWVSIISPIFVACLIIFVSGVKLSEQAAAEKYGDREDYQLYRAQTSKFFLWPPKDTKSKST